MRVHPLFKKRYIPDIEWSGGKLITHDVFRLFERIFGRKFGIRAEASVRAEYVDGKIIQHQEFYTMEAFLVFCECAVRKYIKNLEFGFEFIELPVFQFAGVLPQQEGIRIPIFKFAIANTSTVVNGFTSNGTSCTISLTTSGSDRAAIGCIWTWNAANTYTSTTYAGSTMTELGNRAADGSGSFIRLTGKHNATTGTNNLISNTSGNMQHISTAASYSGVNSTSAAAAFPDTATSGTSSGVTSITASLTTSVSNSWVFLHARTASRDMSASTDTFERCQASISGDSANLYDSNAARATGSNSLIYTWTTAQTSYWVMSSMTPAAAALLGDNFQMGADF